MSATGSPVAASNDVTLTASNLPPGQFGIFVTSLTQDFVPNVGAGNLCLGGVIGRYQAQNQIQQADAGGQFSFQINTNGMPQGSNLIPILPGDAWNFQAWHRDVAGGGPTSNFTDGLEIQFQ